MLNSKLIDIFLQLDKKEMKLLSKFVYSPVYNQHKDVTALFEYISSLDKYTEANLGKEAVYQVIFPKSKYDDLRLRHVVSYLLRVCEVCLAYIETSLDENYHRVSLLKAYRRRSLNRHFSNDLLLQKKSTRESSKKSASGYLIASQVSGEAFAASLLNNNAEAHYLEESDNSLTFYFLLTKLKNRCRLLAYKSELGSLNQSLLPEILFFIEKQDLTRHPEIDCYYHAYNAFENPQEIGFYNVFKEKLSTHALRFEHEELKELFALAIQYCKNKLEDGFLEFEKELFEIYLHGLASEALLHNQTLGFEAQKSIVDLGLQLREISWVEDFISDSKHLTDKAYREELFRLNTAKIYFSKANFKACLKLLNEERIKSLEVQLDAHRLKIKALQEMKDNAQLRVENQKLKELLQKK